MANSRFINALNHEPQKVPPIWMMRQAGRYHSHYQKLRERYSFIELCKNPELAAQVALGPVLDFDFDVAILFSDLLFPLEALGMGLQYTDKGPELGWHLTSENRSKLLSVDAALPALEFQKQAMMKTRQHLSVEKSLIGFVGGPWTLFTYATQGRHEGSLLEAKTKLGLFSSFCETLVPLLIENIRLQLEGGAELVMIFDTAAGELSPGIFNDLVLPQLIKLGEEYNQKLGYYSKGTTAGHLKNLRLCEVFKGIGFDHRWDLVEILKVQTKGFTQGNFDQALLFQETKAFEKTLLRYLEPLKALSVKERAGWVCGLGHGVLPKTPPENVRRFVQLVREVLA